MGGKNFSIFYCDTKLWVLWDEEKKWGTNIHESEPESSLNLKSFRSLIKWALKESVTPTLYPL